MIVLLVMSVISFIVTAGLSGSTTIGLAVGAVFFIFGLPGAALVSLIFGIASYSQDRADYRQMQSNFTMQDIAEQHEEAEDARSAKNRPRVLYDNRRQHIHLHGGA